MEQKKDSNLNIVVGAVYENTKNHKHYKVIALGKHSETLEDMVVYEAQYQNELSRIWIRPAKMFFEEVKRNGLTKPRFVLVSLPNDSF